jgi:hypothetical protein
LRRRVDELVEHQARDGEEMQASNLADLTAIVAN